MQQRAPTLTDLPNDVLRLIIHETRGSVNIKNLALTAKRLAFLIKTSKLSRLHLLINPKAYELLIQFLAIDPYGLNEDDRIFFIKGLLGYLKRPGAASELQAIAATCLLILYQCHSNLPEAFIVPNLSAKVALMLAALKKEVPFLAYSLAGHLAKFKDDQAALKILKEGVRPYQDLIPWQINPFNTASQEKIIKTIVPDILALGGAWANSIIYIQIFGTPLIDWAQPTARTIAGRIIAMSSILDQSLARKIVKTILDTQSFRPMQEGQQGYREHLQSLHAWINAILSLTSLLDHGSLLRFAKEVLTCELYPSTAIFLNNMTTYELESFIRQSYTQDLVLFPYRYKDVGNYIQGLNKYIESLTLIKLRNLYLVHIGLGMDENFIDFMISTGNIEKLIQLRKLLLSEEVIIDCVLTIDREKLFNRWNSVGTQTSSTLLAGVLVAACDETLSQQDFTASFDISADSITLSSNLLEPDNVSNEYILKLFKALVFVIPPLMQINLTANTRFNLFDTTLTLQENILRICQGINDDQSAFIYFWNHLPIGEQNDVLNSIENDEIDLTVQELALLSKSMSHDQQTELLRIFCRTNNPTAVIFSSLPVVRHPDFLSILKSHIDHLVLINDFRNAYRLAVNILPHLNPQEAQTYYDKTKVQSYYENRDLYGGDHLDDFNLLLAALEVKLPSNPDHALICRLVKIKPRRNLPEALAAVEEGKNYLADLKAELAAYCRKSNSREGLLELRRNLIIFLETANLSKEAKKELLDTIDCSLCKYLTIQDKEKIAVPLHNYASSYYAGFFYNKCVRARALIQSIVKESDIKKLLEAEIAFCRQSSVYENSDYYRALIKSQEILHDALIGVAVTKHQSEEQRAIKKPSIAPQ